MCQKVNYGRNPNNRIDKCMRGIIKSLKLISRKNNETVACCCGHGKYAMTILVKDRYGNVWDLFSREIIPRKKRFYKRDSKGHYYIPEVHGEQK